MPSEPVLRFGGATMAFRLETVFGDTPGFAPEDLVGQVIELEGTVDETGFPYLKGRVRSVEPYIDPALGPGHWVVLA